MSFFTDFYGPHLDGWLTIWTKRDKRTEWFRYPSEVDKADAYVAKRMVGEDVYFGVCLRRAEKTSGRGTIQDVLWVPAFYLDIDIKDPAAHKGEKLPETAEDALAFLAELPIPPSFTVHSGFGVHAYWMIAPAVNADIEGIDRVAASMKTWNDDVNYAAALRGWEFDPVCEPARVLRVPGSLNHKASPPVAVGQPEGDWTAYSGPEFQAAHAALRQMAPTQADLEIARVAASFRLPETIADGGRNNTLYQYACSLRGKGYEFDAILAGIRAANEKVCRPPLPDSEIAAIAKSACTHPVGMLKAAGAKTAQDTAIVLPPAPVTAMEAGELISNAVLDTLLFAPDLVERQLRLEACRKRAKELGVLRGFNDLWKAKLSAHAAAQARATHDGSSGVEIVLPDIPITGLRLCDWEIDERGVRRMRTSNGVPTVEQACPHPILVTERLSNVDTQIEKVRLAWRRVGEPWEDMVTTRSIAASRQGIVALADTGIMVTSENAKYLVQYLHELEATNVSVIPKKRSVSRCGWIGTQEFAPYCEGVTFDGDPRMRGLFEAVGASGDQGKWVEAARSARTSLMARAIMAASFAAPLVWVLGKPVFFVHLWGQTGTGKTVALYLAASVWGDPKTLTKTFNATGVGMERSAAFFHSLPFCLDEFQTLDRKKVDVDNLLYSLAEGKSKGRGTKFGGIETEARWGNVIITNGEEPMTTMTSGGGAKNRTIEMCVNKPVFADAPKMAEVISANYGHAGQLFIGRLIDLIMDESVDRIRKDYEKIREGVGYHPDYTDKQASALAIMTLAEYYACRFVFGMDKDAANAAAVELMYALRDQLTEAREVDQAVRAWEWVEGWLSSNKAHFKQDLYEHDSDPIFGLIEGQTWYVIGSVMDEALTKAGFSARKCVHEFAERGQITRPAAGIDGKQRTKTKSRRIGGAPVWCYEIPRN